MILWLLPRVERCKIPPISRCLYTKGCETFRPEINIIEHVQFKLFSERDFAYIGVISSIFAFGAFWILLLDFMSTSAYPILDVIDLEPRVVLPFVSSQFGPLASLELFSSVSTSLDVFPVPLIKVHILLQSFIPL